MLKKHYKPKSVILNATDYRLQIIYTVWNMNFYNSYLAVILND